MEMRNRLKMDIVLLLLLDVGGKETRISTNSHLGLADEAGFHFGTIGMVEHSYATVARNC